MDKKQNPRLLLRHDSLAMEKPYEIKKIFNSTKYVPNDRLTKKEVNDRINAGWSVEVQ